MYAYLIQTTTQIKTGIRDYTYYALFRFDYLSMFQSIAGLINMISKSISYRYVDI